MPRNLPRYFPFVWTAALCPRLSSRTESVQPSPQVQPRFGLSSSVPSVHRGPLLNTTVLDLLFIQQMSPELLPRSSAHCARPMKTREQDVPLGALGMGTMGQLQQWSDSCHQGIIRRPSIPVLEGQRGF